MESRDPEIVRLTLLDRVHHPMNYGCSNRILQDELHELGNLHLEVKVKNVIAFCNARTVPPYRMLFLHIFLHIRMQADEGFFYMTIVIQVVQ